MIVLLSPAKSLDLESPVPINDTSNPLFVKESEKVVKQLARLSSKELGTLMNLSDKLTQLNHQRYASWNKLLSRQAIFAFNGDVYSGLDAYTLSKSHLLYAQNRLSILSGLYGLLRPLDLIKPYRLEMGTKFSPIKNQKSLYEFWGTKLSDAINQRINESSSSILINLASKEYSRVIQMKSIQAKVIDITFKDEKNGTLKVISFYAKKARGQMARFIIENQINTCDKLKQFSEDGYQYTDELSSDLEFVFTR